MFKEKSTRILHFFETYVIGMCRRFSQTWRKHLAHQMFDPSLWVLLNVYWTKNATFKHKNYRFLRCFPKQIQTIDVLNACSTVYILNMFLILGQNPYSLKTR